jgi:hypothetical protein
MDALQMAGLANGLVMDWSDSWSDEDLKEATVASLLRFEEEEREGS